MNVIQLIRISTTVVSYSCAMQYPTGAGVIVWVLLYVCYCTGPEAT